MVFSVATAVPAQVIEIGLFPIGPVAQNDTGGSPMSLNAVLLKTPIEGSSWHAKCSSSRASVPTMSLESRQDLLLFVGDVSFCCRNLMAQDVGECFDAKDRTVTENRCADQRVLELPNITGPVIAEKELECLRSNRQASLATFGAESLEKVLA